MVISLLESDEIVCSVSFLLSQASVHVPEEDLRLAFGLDGRVLLEYFGILMKEYLVIFFFVHVLGFLMCGILG